MSSGYEAFRQKLVRQASIDYDWSVRFINRLRQFNLIIYILGFHIDSYNVSGYKYIKQVTMRLDSFFNKRVRSTIATIVYDAGISGTTVIRNMRLFIIFWVFD